MQMRGTPVTRANLPGRLGSEALHCEGTWGCFPEVERNRPLASPTTPCCLLAPPAKLSGPGDLEGGAP